VPEASVVAAPAEPNAVEPFHSVRLVNAGLTVVVEATTSTTFKSVTFTFSMFEVSVKRNAASGLPVAPITIWPIGAWLESAATEIVAPVVLKLKFWPACEPHVIELYEI